VILAILRDEVRRWRLTPAVALGAFLIGAVVARLLGPNARYVLPYNWLGMVIFGLSMGAQSIAGGHDRDLAQWQAQWPVSRLRWWAAKLLAAGGATLVVAALADAMFVLIAREAVDMAGPDAVSLYLLYPLRSAVGAFAIGFYVSSITRSSFTATLLAGGLMSLLMLSSGLVMRTMLVRGYDFPVWPAYVTMLGPVIFLTSSYVGYMRVPSLEFARGTRRAVITLTILLVSFRLVLVAVQLAAGPA
jgi:hypothetical protein